MIVLSSKASRALTIESATSIMCSARASAGEAAKAAVLLVSSRRM
jgi:hypothetical protein